MSTAARIAYYAALALLGAGTAAALLSWAATGVGDKLLIAALMVTLIVWIIHAQTLRSRIDRLRQMHNGTVADLFVALESQQ
jgi:parvulin-like peptidyl-prolyl isomerase